MPSSARTPIQRARGTQKAELPPEEPPVEEPPPPPGASTIDSTPSSRVLDQVCRAAEPPEAVVLLA